MQSPGCCNVNLISFLREIFAQAFQMPRAATEVTVNGFMSVLFIYTIQSKHVQHSYLKFFMNLEVNNLF